MVIIIIIALFIQYVQFGYHYDKGGLETQSFRNGPYLGCRCTKAHRLDVDYASAL